MKLSSYEVTQLCVLMLCHSASAYISVSISIYIYIYTGWLKKMFPLFDPLHLKNYRSYVIQIKFMKRSNA